MKVLVTGAAGFIGMHVTQALLSRGDTVFGIDNLNDYYDPALKQARLKLVEPHPSFSFERIDIADRQAMSKFFSKHAPERVVHLAAQAGVRYSLKNPHAYADSNLTGFLNVLEGCRQQEVDHLVYASSSSVYGANTKMPFSVTDNVDYPVSLYAATKKANELMAFSYSHLYHLPVTGLRFFTVYGPWGRPDMAYFSFTRAILEGRPIDVYNHGDMQRDFTYIDDIVEGLVRVLDRAPETANGKMDVPERVMVRAPARLYNIGNHQPVRLMDFIAVLERTLGREAVKNLLPMQPGDVPATYADVDDLMRDVGFKPETSIESGLARFAAWYLDYYRIQTHNTTS